MKLKYIPIVIAIVTIALVLLNKKKKGVKK